MRSHHQDPNVRVKQEGFQRDEGLSEANSEKLKVICRREGRDAPKDISLDF